MDANVYHSCGFWYALRCRRLADIQEQIEFLFIPRWNKSVLDSENEYLSHAQINTVE